MLLLAWISAAKCVSKWFPSRSFVRLFSSNASPQIGHWSSSKILRISEFTFVTTDWLFFELGRTSFLTSFPFSLRSWEWEPFPILGRFLRDFWAFDNSSFSTADANSVVGEVSVNPHFDAGSPNNVIVSWTCLCKTSRSLPQMIWNGEKIFRRFPAIKPYA